MIDNPSRCPSYRQTTVLNNMYSCPLHCVVSMAEARGRVKGRAFLDRQGSLQLCEQA